MAAHRPDTLLECYRIIDATLGNLRAKYGPAVTLVVSDHGLKLLGPDHSDPRTKVLPGLGGCIPLENFQSIWTGDHHADAFYAFSGPGVPARGRTDIDFLQIFPLLLDSLGIAIPPDLPGKLPSL